MKAKSIILVWLIGFLGTYQAAAQVAAGAQPYSLQQAIQFAFHNQTSIINARLNEGIAKAKVGEIRAMGLPQVNAAIDVGNNLIVPTSFIPAEIFGGPAGSFAPVKFGTQYSSTAVLTGNQLLFDGSYLIGLKAAKTYTDLSVKQTQQTERDVQELVTKAYYGVLVNRERIVLLDRNVARLDTTLRETKLIYKQGFAEKLDVDRLQVAFNNLVVEKQKADRLLALSVDLLKFQMGLKQDQPITLTDKLDDLLVNIVKPADDNFNYSNRIEYSVLESQRDLTLLDIKNKKSGYWPKLYLSGRYGFNAAGNEFSRLYKFSEKSPAPSNHGPYFSQAFVGLSFQMPVFDGLRKSYQIKQAKLTLETVNNSFTMLQQSIDLQRAQANTSLENALQVLESQKSSLQLAEEVTRVTRIKFKEGVGSNLEVINAETELRQAQTNYYAALYDVVIAQVDFQKANGGLTSK